MHVLIDTKAEIFSEGHTVEAVAADWISRWEQNNTEAMTDLVNFVIRCSGCRETVDVHAIEDPDNAVSKLTDLQDEFQQLAPSDYPLISRLKANASFRPTITNFFETLIQACHASGVLYSDLAIIENIEVWVSTMSSAGTRPFRHTATVISLAIANQLCRVATENSENAAKTARQKDGERKKKKINQQRVKELDAKVIDLQRKREQALESIQSIFNTVFVHRYRDVDPKIRVDCVTALGNWIVTLPDVFFEGIYLRYLGWVLSDPWAPTRAEVIKQLTRLFKNKDNVARLRHFTERFRPRLVEMATRDSEVGIRASTVDLLDLIRETGLLEPDDIDNIGRLVFDAEPRVRKAVTGFFAENIQDMYDDSVEALGGENELADTLGEEAESSPRPGWLKIKCVVEALQSYDAEGDEDGASQELMAGLAAAGTDSRYALAAQTIYDGVEATRDWEMVASYLLYDLSAATAPFEQRCQLTEKEEILLLEVLNASVKQNLLDAADADKQSKAKRSKARRNESAETQEMIASNLAAIIPNLLRKYGSASSTASIVLRLEHVLNLEIFQELRQDSTAYASLLDDINKQFLTHADTAVLTEASTALLHARSFEDLEEVTEGKVDELWDNTINSLKTYMSLEDWVEQVQGISATVRRIAHLASIMDCILMFHAERTPSVRNKKKKTPSSVETTCILDLLLIILREPALDSEAGEVADDLLANTMKALLLYYMWRVRDVQVRPTEPIIGYPEPEQYALALINLIQSRQPTDTVRLAALGNLLDLHTLFATFRHKDAHLQHLVSPVDASAEPLILATFTALEKNYAKKSKRKVEVPLTDSVDDAPEDDDEDEDDDLEGDDNDQQNGSLTAERRQQETMLAEQRLCEITGKIVLAIVARVLDHAPRDAEGGRKRPKIGDRIVRNKTKLGSNFKEVLAYLDNPAAKASKNRKTPAQTRKAEQARKAKSRARVEDEEDSDDDVDVDADGEGADGGEEGGEEEGGEEDRIVDPDNEDGEAQVNGNGEDGDEDEDEIMGD